MNDQQIISDLTPIFRDVFDDEALVPAPSMTAEDVDTWDSLSHIRLIVAVESHFSIRFTSAEVGAFQNVGQFISAIQSKLGTPAP